MDWLSLDNRFFQVFFVEWYRIEDLVCISNCDLGKYVDPEDKLKTWAIKDTNIQSNTWSEFNITEYGADRQSISFSAKLKN